MTRRMQYRGDLDAEWASYGADTRAIAAAFVRGVNAWVAIARAASAGRVRAGGLAAGVLDARGSAQPHRGVHDEPAGPARGPARAPRSGGGRPPRRRADAARPAGRDRRAVRGSTSAASMRASATRCAASGPRRSSSDSRRRCDRSSRARMTAATTGRWRAGARRTGAPILANDPHRHLDHPSLRYLVHLSAPGWNVIGSTEPWMPGVAIGHNDRIAWGLTIFDADGQDLYVERVNPANPHQVMDRGRVGGHDARRPIRFAVKGRAKPFPGEHEFTRHGPDRRHRPGAPPGVRAAMERRGAGNGRLPGGARDRPRAVVAGVSRGAVALEGARRELRLRGRGRQHRLSGGGARADPARVDRHAAGAGLVRCVRMARLVHARRSAACVQSAGRLSGHGEQRHAGSRRPARDQLRMGQPGTHQPDPRSLRRDADLLGGRVTAPAARRARVERRAARAAARRRDRGST